MPGQGKSLVKSEFRVPRPTPIEMVPEKLLPNAPNKQVPKFRIHGMLDSDICYFSDDINGYFVVEVSLIKKLFLYTVIIKNILKKYFNG